MFDHIHSLTVAQTAGSAERNKFEEMGLRFGAQNVGLAELVAAHKSVLEFSQFRIALLIDHAAHLKCMHGETLEEFFVAVDINSARLRPTKRRHQTNPTLWLVDHPADLPDWFVRNNGSIREVQVEAPNLEDRFQFARHLAHRHGWQESGSIASCERWLQQFALECDGQTLVAMEAILEVSRAEGFGLERISDAMRVFRTGSRRNPWTSPVLKSRMQGAKTMLEARIKGQPHAIDKTLDILARSILGLSGIQSGAMHARPYASTLLRVHVEGIAIDAPAAIFLAAKDCQELPINFFPTLKFPLENAQSPIMTTSSASIVIEGGCEAANAAGIPCENFSNGAAGIPGAILFPSASQSASQVSESPATRAEQYFDQISRMAFSSEA